MVTLKFSCSKTDNIDCLTIFAISIKQANFAQAPLLCISTLTLLKQAYSTRLKSSKHVNMSAIDIPDIGKTVYLQID
jgi:hypothetical protein